MHHRNVFSALIFYLPSHLPSAHSSSYFIKLSSRPTHFSDLHRSKALVFGATSEVTNMPCCHSTWSFLRKLTVFWALYRVLPSSSPLKSSDSEGKPKIPTCRFFETPRCTVHSNFSKCTLCGVFYTSSFHLMGMSRPNSVGHGKNKKAYERYLQAFPCC